MPQATLGQWLQYTTDRVSVQCLTQLMGRMEEHEPKRHTEAATLLSNGVWPDLLYESTCVNAAVLCMMHALRSHSLQADPFLPAITTHSPTGVEINTQDIGEVWWLFDAEWPYLAEVFKSGEVPSSRLPHMDRRQLAGKDVARILGPTKPNIKVLRSKMTKCPYSLRCVTKVLMRGFGNTSAYYITQVYTCTCVLNALEPCMQYLNSIGPFTRGSHQEAA
jgi:hypothetical protein